MRGKDREMHIMNIVNLAKDRSARIEFLIFQVEVQVCPRRRAESAQGLALLLKC